MVYQNLYVLQISIHVCCLTAINVIIIQKKQLNYNTVANVKLKSDEDLRVQWLDLRTIRLIEKYLGVC